MARLPPSANTYSAFKFNIVLIAIMCFVITISQISASRLDSLTDYSNNDDHPMQMIHDSTPEFIPEEQTDNLDDGENINENSHLPMDYHDDFEVRPDDSPSYSKFLKKKRFLGSMARANWFPNKYRSFIDTDGQFSGSSGPSALGLWSLPYPEKKHLSVMRSRQNYNNAPSKKLTRFKLLSMYSPVIGPSYRSDEN